MSHEILYTSARKLLKAGMSGYGTVISTRGISSHLAEKLEGLSGYRWAYEPGTPNAHLNPVCYSHVQIAVAGQKYQVLSRVSDYGADYSGRTNKIAHHVALLETELTAGGPAWILKSDGFCESTWDQQTRVIETGRQPTRSVRSSADYSLWERVTGDAGWAGVLAETALAAERRPVHVLFPLGMDTLSLIEESLNLLPHRERWKVSFSSYYNSLPASVDCLWRFVLDGTPEAANLRRQPHQTIIDLCSKLIAPAGGELVQKAREGWQPIPVVSSAAPTRLPLKPGMPAAATMASPASSVDRSELSQAYSYRIDADVPELPPHANTPPVPRRSAGRTQDYESSNRSGWRLPLWATLLLCILVGAGAGATGFWVGQRSESPKVSNHNNAKDAGSPKSTKDQAADSAPQLATNSGPDKKPAISTEDDNGTDVMNVEPGPKTPSQKTAAQEAGISTGNTPPEVPPVLTPGDLPPPEVRGKSDIADAVSSTPMQNAPILDFIDIPVWDSHPDKYEVATNVSSFEPEVYGSPLVLDAQQRFSVAKSNEPGKWDLVIDSDHANNESGYSNANDTKPVKNSLAVFTIENGRLTFKWNPTTSKRHVSNFRKCMLRLNKHDSPRQLSKPISITSVVLIPVDNGEHLVRTFSTDKGEPPVCTLPSNPSPIACNWTLDEELAKSYQLNHDDALGSNDHKNDRNTSVTITDLDGNVVAKIAVDFRSNDGEDEMSTAAVKLYALIPPDSPEKDPAKTLWSLGNSTDDARNFHPKVFMKKRSDITKSDDPNGDSAYITKAESWVADVNNAWDKDGNAKGSDQVKLIEARVKNGTIDPGLKMNIISMQLTSEGVEYKKKLVKELTRDVKLIRHYQSLGAWRSRMDKLTNLIKGGGAVSFDICYDIDVKPGVVKYTVARAMKPVAPIP